MPIGNLYDIDLENGKPTKEPQHAPGVYGTISRPQPLPPGSFFIWTNGMLNINTPEKERASGGILATATVPVVPVASPESEIEEKTVAMIDAILSVIEQQVNITFGTNMQSDDPTKPITKDTLALIDQAVPTWDKTPRDSVHFQRLPKDQLISFDRQWWNMRLIEIQTMMTELIRQAPVFVPELRMVGYSNCEIKDGKIKVERRVSNYITWEDGQHIAAITMPVDPFEDKPKRDNYLYLAVLARATQRMIPEPSEDKVVGHYGKYYGLNDLIAYWNDRLLDYSPPGEPGVNTKRIYTAEDIYDNVMSSIGLGLSESDRYMFNTQQSWINWFVLNIVWGIVSSRIKGTVNNVSLRILKTKKLNSQAVNTFGLVGNAAQYDLKGGQTNIWHPMARNLIKEMDIPMPTIVAEKFYSDEITENEYVQPRKGRHEFSTVESRFGHAMSSVIEVDPDKEVRKRMIIHSDMLRYDVAIESGIFARDLVIYSIGWNRVLANGDMNEEQRRFNWFFGLQFSATTCSFSGYAILPPLKMFTTSSVTFTQTPFGEVSVEKKDTKTIGEQQLAPGASMLTADSLERRGPKDDKEVASLTNEVHSADIKAKGDLLKKEE